MRGTADSSGALFDYVDLEEFMPPLPPARRNA